MRRTIFIATLTAGAWLAGAATVLAPATVAAAAVSAADTAYLDQMAAAHLHDSPAATPAATAAPAQPVDAEEVAFGQAAGKPARGYLAHPREIVGKAPVGGTAVAPVPLPGIIAIHEWWGLNDHVKAMARRLAGEGYTVLAVDLFNGKVADTPDEAKKLVGEAMANPGAAMAVLKAAEDYLTRQGAPKVGVIGWCFGGAWSLQAALELQPGIDAAVMYYGRPEKDRARLAKLRVPLLGLFGADDTSIPPAAVREMEATLKQLGKSVEIQIYPGAGHAFASPSGTSYRPAAADDAWKRTVAFFKHHLQGA